MSEQDLTIVIPHETVQAELDDLDRGFCGTGALIQRGETNGGQKFEIHMNCHTDESEFMNENAKPIAGENKAKALLHEIVDALASMGTWQDLEVGEYGEGPFLRAVEFLEYPKTDEIEEWLKEDDPDDFDGEEQDET